MILKQRLFSNMFLRNMLADFGNRSIDSTTPGNFTPYFQYRLGNYQPGYYLYFPKEPYGVRYRNEVFNKLKEFSGFEIIRYLDFHYLAYPGKKEFLRFMQYELSSRIKKKPRSEFRLRLQSAAEWVTEKQQQIQAEQQAALKQDIERGVQEIVHSKHTDSEQEKEEISVQVLSKKLGDHIEHIMTSAEENMQILAGSYITGQIELNNHNHLEKLVQLFILIQTVQAPHEKAKVEQLFKKFSGTDIASILHLHFEPFKNKKINTIQVRIREAAERINPNNPKVQKLTAALVEFFYQ